MARRILYPQILERRLGKAQQPSRFARVVGRIPSRHGEYAVRCEAGEEVPPALDRVELVLREREGPDPGRGPGVGHAHLHEIELPASPGAREPTARLVHLELDAGKRGETVEVAKPLLQRIDEDWIALDPGHVAKAAQVGG